MTNKFIPVLLLFFLFSIQSYAQPQKQKDNDSITASEYYADWDFYLTLRNDRPASISLDLGYQKIAPINDLPYFVWVSLKINSPLKDGLCSDEEGVKLGQIEDSLFNALKRHKKVKLVGRLTNDGARDIYFYLGDTSHYEIIISNVFKQYPYYEYDFGKKQDVNWDFYKIFLYPKPIEYQRIINRRMVDDLDHQGDNLTQPRDVFHWIYFKTEQDREEFLTKIKDDKFTVVDKDFDTKYGKYPYRLHIKRTDKVDWDSVDDYVLYLWQVAKDCHGNYDSWETTFQR